MLVDYSTIRPSMAVLKTAGVTAVGRYLGQDCTPGYQCIHKNLTKPEATELHGAGIDIWLAFEYAADQALKGAAQGTADAHLAAQQLRDLGAPGDVTVYFALDFDIRDYAPGSTSAVAKLGPVADYFGAINVANVPYKIGVYGGYWAVSRVLDANLATRAWQTIAWSGGQWDTRAVLRQSVRQVLGGADVDTHKAMWPDFGQWHAKPPATTWTPGHVAHAAWSKVMDDPKLPWWGKLPAREQRAWEAAAKAVQPAAAAPAPETAP